MDCRTGRRITGKPAWSTVPGATSAWVPLGGAAGTDVGVDQTAPQRPIIQSATNPNQYRWYNTRVPSFSWSAKDIGSGVQGYSYLLERQAHVIPPGTVSSQTSLAIERSVRRDLVSGVASGRPRRELECDGHLSVASRPTGAPALVAEPEQVHDQSLQGGRNRKFAVNKDSSVRLTLYRVGAKAPVASFSYPVTSAAGG